MAPARKQTNTERASTAVYLICIIGGIGLLMAAFVMYGFNLAWDAPLGELILGIGGVILLLIAGGFDQVDR
jgi:hypothetical protein